jgi:hypothetical protein
MCWPVYASVLASVGLGFLTSSTYLFPLTVGFLMMVIAALLYGARERWGHGPFILGLVGSTALVVGKFQLESNPIMYCGVVVLICSSVWNVWPRKSSAVRCQQCSIRE